MIAALDYLRQLNAVSLLFRLALAMFFGGMIGMERERAPPGGLPHLYAGLPGSDAGRHRQPV